MEYLIQPEDQRITRFTIDGNPLNLLFYWTGSVIYVRYKWTTHDGPGLFTIHEGEKFIGKVTNKWTRYGETTLIVETLTATKPDYPCNVRSVDRCVAGKVRKKDYPDWITKPLPPLTEEEKRRMPSITSPLAVRPKKPDKNSPEQVVECGVVSTEPLSSPTIPDE